MFSFNSHAIGMAVARPYGFEVDFVRRPISGSAAWFFGMIREFIFTPIFDTKKKFIFESRFHPPRKSLTQTWLNFSEAKSNEELRSIWYKNLNNFLNIFLKILDVFSRP